MKCADNNSPQCNPDGAVKLLSLSLCVWVRLGEVPVAKAGGQERGEAGRGAQGTAPSAH